jgi:hypothetical protein
MGLLNIGGIRYKLPVLRLGGMAHWSSRPSQDRGFEYPSGNKVFAAMQWFKNK